MLDSVIPLRLVLLSSKNQSCDLHCKTIGWFPYENEIGHKLVFGKPDPHLPIKFVLFALMKAIKNDEKGFLFYLKTSFRSQDI